jgi:ABC-type transport system involved in cytochrome c biogenesis permease subunit
MKHIEKPARFAPYAKYFPWIAAVITAVSALIGSGMLGSGEVRNMDVGAFARVPVLEGGRVKPLDSVARNSLLVIRSQQSFRFNDRTVGPDEWLLDVLFRPDVADDQPIFVINDPDVLGLIGIKQSAERYFSFHTLVPHIEEIQKQADTAHPIEAKTRTRFQSAIVNLFDRLYLYHRLKHTLQIAGSDGGLAQEIADVNAAGAEERQTAMRELGLFRAFPGAKLSDWRSAGEALRDARAGQPLDATGSALDRGLAPMARLGDAWLKQDAPAFNTAVKEVLALARPDEAKQARNERTFNVAQPFYVGMVVYVLALLILFVSWAYWPQYLQPVAFAVLLVGVFIHTAGLTSRVILQGRPPVTNLYSSAVFVGWGAVVLGSVLEWIYRKGFGTAVAAASGFASLIIAHHLASDGDTMEMMRAVLDSNFWLATHVVTITIGYSGTFLAGAIAIGWTIRKHVVKDPDPANGKALVSMAYGIVCFAVLFSFVGTVLGGIWADQSWGRFWGWDPKENGALLIVLWNSIILHMRLGGYARDRGIMAMAIFGNIITSCSWFGVNMLGVGLHSYGFMDKAFWALIAFGATQLVFIALALLPRRFWRRGPAPGTPHTPAAAA